jgi:tetratricopeptide (TPR) repeat protein
MKRAARLVAVGLWLVSRVAWSHGNVEERIDALTVRIGAHPDDASLWAERGALQVLDENWTQAEIDFEEARTIDPAVPGVDLPLGNTWLHLGDYPRVVAAMTAVIARQPTNADAYLLRARALVAMGESGDAAPDFTQVIALSKTPIPRTFRERADALEASGDRDAAAWSLREGIERLGPAVTMVEPLIELEERRGEFAAALALIDNLPDGLQESPKWRIRRAATLARAGRGEDAKVAYAEALHAIRALPASRRAQPAMVDLEAEATRSLDALGVDLVVPERPPDDRLWWMLVGALALGGGAWMARSWRGRPAGSP